MFRCNIRLLAKVLFLMPQPCPSPSEEGLKILSQEVYSLQNTISLFSRFCYALPKPKIWHKIFSNLFSTRS